MKLLRFKLIFIILVFTLPTLADDVIEGGVFTEEKSGLPIENLGGKSGESLPSEQFYSSERQANAPVNKTLFVVGDDGVCYYGNFKVLDSRKVLVVYHNSKAPLENCIYQKKLTPDPSGFAIFEKKGGVCKPVYADSIEDMRKDRDGLREINNIVSIAYCTDKTFSFGQHYHPTKVKMAKPEIIVTNVAIEKPELKPEPKPELKPEIKPEVKAEVKPEPKVELKPEPLPTKLPEKKIVQHKAEHKIKAKPKTKLKVLGNKKHKKKIEEKEDTFSFSDWFSKMKTKIGDSYQARFGKKEKPKELEEDELDEDEKDVWDEEPQKMAPKVVKKIPNVKRTQASVKQHYTIQVGAYPTEVEAQKAGEEISTLDDNLEPFHYTAEVNERTWYRVAVGQYDSFKEAKRALTQVKSVTKGAAFIQSIDPKDFPTE